MKKKEEQYIPDYPWSLIKSYLLTFNRKEYCEAYEQLRADDEITSDTSFPFVYFYSIVRIGIMRCYHPRWTRKSNNIIMNNMQTLY